MPYFMLYTREGEGAEWAPQFGDRDKDSVIEERESWLDAEERIWGVRPTVKGNTRIVKFARVPGRRQVEEVGKGLK